MGMKEMEEVSEIIMQELVRVMSCCNECEVRVNEFVKIANCILNREEYYQLLNQYKKFESNFNILESLSIQIDYPLSMLQIVTLKAMMKELKKDFEQLALMLEMSNERIDKGQINFPMAHLIQRILKVVEFDAINYDDLEQAMESSFIILKKTKLADPDYPQDYYPFNVLRIKLFKDKISAYKYALENGISRDYVLNRYG